MVFLVKCVLQYFQVVNSRINEANNVSDVSVANLGHPLVYIRGTMNRLNLMQLLYIKYI